MARGTMYFVQECPTCGRNLQVRVEYLGKRVACQHCSAKFEARQSDPADPQTSDSGTSMLERAEQLLQTAEASGIGLGDRSRHTA